MLSLANNSFDLTAYWTWFLLFVRTEAILMTLPGIGRDEIPEPIRISLAMALALLVTLSGPRAMSPETLAGGALMITSEFLLGFIIGALPLFIISSLAIAGQITSGAIGLGQANMIDPTLGEAEAVLARLEVTIATLTFLLIDGHHVIIHAIAGVNNGIGIGTFNPDMGIAQLLLNRFGDTFSLAMLVTAPVMATILVTQFVLGLVTKSVPHVNIFIISLPLTIGLGLYITIFTLPGMSQHLVHEFGLLEELIAQVMFRH